jgi:hypothetical protein
MPALDLGYSACRSTGGSAPMQVESFLRLGIGIAIAAFNTREVAFGAASRGA